MSLLVHFGGDHPFAVEGTRLGGYHRPLGGGEAANLQVTMGYTAALRAWLECPPLGLPCSVSFDGETILSGALYGIRVTAEAVELRLEG